MKDLSEKEAKELILKYVSINEVNEWVKRNPIPKEWFRKNGKYSWACTEMPVGKFFTWWRKRVLKWKI